MTHAKICTSLLAASLAGFALADTTVVTFDDGAEGWTGPAGFGGSTFVDPAGGNPGANLHTQFQDFGITFDNSTHPAWAQDFTRHASVTFSVDLQVVSIADFNGETVRPWLVEIRDYDNPPAGYPWVSVFYLFDWVSQSPFTTWSVTIDDTNAVDLPAGWGGTGSYDPQTFESALPADRTFASVLAGADEVAYTTFLPDYFFIDNMYDLRIDNVTVTTTDGAMPGDVDGNGVVDFDDLLQLLAAWGPCDGPCAADFDGNTMVDFDDLLVVLGNWS